MEFSELFWRKVRFVLLFLLFVSTTFIILTKFIFKIPIIESKDLLVNISVSERILEEQERYVEKVKILHDSISVVKFEINQVQKLNEIKSDIHMLQNVYKKNNMNNKYIFGVQSSKILKIYFDARESLNKVKKNNEVLEKNLNECKANI
ncbi:type VI secretion system TssO [Tenacibaculum maritimum]|uniref:type VI secretion system TssO n=1 Tax=Tenacibaculum maritimum TaxID=107401 RepID=UPI002307FCCF|nr:type VI secretion system TssO [Tenacibaculum maritimum]MDB0613249.1 type VI secretion system TssO [Tenacibaculum maritimum]